MSERSIPYGRQWIDEDDISAVVEVLRSEYLTTGPAVEGFEDALAALKNIKRSGSRYLLTTTFTERDSNMDIQTGQWRPLNMLKPPFSFPSPIMIINEKCTEGDGSWGDKSLGLWKISDIPAEAPPAQRRRTGGSG